MNYNKNNMSKGHNTVSNPKIAEKIKIFMKDRCISCKKSHKIAKLLNEKPIDIGINIDLLNIKINKCQLGLFGCKNKVKAAKNIKLNIKESILKNEKNGKIDCIKTWIISEKFNLIKDEVASVCEKLGIKVSNCQLGAF